MNRIINTWNQASIGKKIYSFLWLFFGIMLVTVILTSSLSKDADAIAAIALIFIISLISAIFTTVFVNMKESKNKKKAK